jgi:hypothetical protein
MQSADRFDLVFFVASLIMLAVALFVIEGTYLTGGGGQSLEINATATATPSPSITPVERGLPGG